MIKLTLSWKRFRGGVSIAHEAKSQKAPAKYSTHHLRRLQVFLLFPSNTVYIVGIKVIQAISSPLVRE